MQLQISVYSFEELEQLRDFFAGLKATVTVENATSSEPVEKSAAKNTTKEVKEEAPTESAAPTEIAAPTNAEAPTESAAPTAPTSTNTEEPLPVRIRQVIQATRDRLGDDNSDAKIHRDISTALTRIAVSLGFDKPSKIDNEEAFASFVSGAKEIIIDNGKVTVDLPF